MIRKWLSTFAFTTLMSLPAAAQDYDFGSMSDAEKEVFGEAVREYLLTNPELLREWITALQDYEAQQEANRDFDLVAENAEALFEDDRSWSGGNIDGDVVLVEFLDYRCSFCRRAHPEVVELVNSDGNIRKIIKEFPILGEESVVASRFAISVLQVAGPEAYKKISDKLMEHRGQFTSAALGELAEREGLDADAITGHMDSEEVTEVIAANHALAQQMAISGTPTFVLGDQMLRGYLPLSDMRALVTELRERG